MQAGRGFPFEPLCNALDELGPVEQQRGRVALQRVVDELGRLLLALVRKRDAYFNTRPVFEHELAELQMHFVAVVGRDMRLRDERLAGRPLAGDRGDQGALDRGLGLGFEVVH